MQKAEHILQAIPKMREKLIPLIRVHRCLYSEDLFLAAYNKIGRNEGALTLGSENDTADGVSIERIRNIVRKLRDERFDFKPSRRTRIPEKSGGSRPLRIPNFSGKQVQEALRMLLEAYYEPHFRDSSHGFRPGGVCHTALSHIKARFTGTKWFIEGDIRGCFENIDHDFLMNYLSKDIRDGHILEFIRRSLKAAYLEDWSYHLTYSGVSHGGVLNPQIHPYRVL
jgi:retron-type reverse transcriptase